MAAIIKRIEDRLIADAAVAGVTEYDDVHDLASFLSYVSVLREELNDPVLSEEWENAELPTFLDAIIAWTADRGNCANPNSWRHMAETLTAATIYRR